MATAAPTRQIKRRRVRVMCIACLNIFGYLYPGCGPYRSLCKKCKKDDPRPYGRHA